MKFSADQFINFYKPKLKNIEKLREKKSSFGKSSLILLKKTLSDFLERGDNFNNIYMTKILPESFFEGMATSFSPRPANISRRAQNLFSSGKKRTNDIKGDSSFMVSKSPRGQKRSRSNMDKSVIEDLRLMGVLKPEKVKNVKLKKENFSDSESEEIEEEGKNNFENNEVEDKVEDERYKIIIQKSERESISKEPEDKSSQKSQRELERNENSSLRASSNKNKEEKNEDKKDIKVRKEEKRNDFDDQDDFFETHNFDIQSEQAYCDDSDYSITQKNATIAVVEKEKSLEFNNNSGLLEPMTERIRKDDDSEIEEDSRSCLTYAKSEIIDPTQQILEIMSLKLNKTFDFENHVEDAEMKTERELENEINKGEIIGSFKKRNIPPLGPKKYSTGKESAPRTIDKQIKEISERSKNLSKILKRDDSHVSAAKSSRSRSTRFKEDKDEKEEGNQFKSFIKKSNTNQIAKEEDISDRTIENRPELYKKVLEQQLKKIKKLDIFKREAFNFNTDETINEKKQSTFFGTSKRSKTSNILVKKETTYKVEESNTYNKFTSPAEVNKKSFGFESGLSWKFKNKTFNRKTEDYGDEDDVDDSRYEAESMMTELNKKSQISDLDDYYQNRSYNFNF